MTIISWHVGISAVQKAKALQVQKTHAERQKIKKENALISTTVNEYMWV